APRAGRTSPGPLQRVSVLGGMNRPTPSWTEALRCPVNGMRLLPAPEEVVKALEAQRQSGRLIFPADEPQSDPSAPIQTAFLREDGRIAYLLEGRTPILLPDHGIPVK